MITYQVEEYADVLAEVQPFLRQHADELATHPDMTLSPAYGTYAESAGKGLLHIVTARVEGQLVGYHVSFLSGHLHYENSLTAYTDVYYLAEEHRRGWEGIHLQRFVEESLAAKGVERIYTTTTKKLNRGRVLEYLGYEECETMYAKRIGGDHE